MIINETIDFIEVVKYLADYTNKKKQKVYALDRGNELLVDCYGYITIKNRWGHILNIRNYDTERKYVVCDYAKYRCWHGCEMLDHYID